MCVDSLTPMTDDQRWTADELQSMSPIERYEAISASIVSDLDEVPHEFLDRIRSNILDHIEATEALERAGTDALPGRQTGVSGSDPSQP